MQFNLAHLVNRNSVSNASKTGKTLLQFRCSIPVGIEIKIVCLKIERMSSPNGERMLFSTFHVSNFVRDGRIAFDNRPPEVNTEYVPHASSRWWTLAKTIRCANFSQYSRNNAQNIHLPKVLTLFSCLLRECRFLASAIES